MPLYEYQCTNCNESFSVVQPVKERPKRKCPVCTKYKLERLLFAPFGFCRKKSGDMGTIGDLANHNRDHKTKWEKEKADNEYEKSSKLAKHKLETQKNGQPWYWNGVDKKKKLKEIKNMDSKQARKYVAEG